MASLLAGAGPVARLWRGYEACLERRPIATQSVTSAVLWGCGDLLAQKFACDAKQQSKLDVRRTALTAVFGGAFIGPAGSAWYARLDSFAAIFGAEGTARFLLAKIAADSTVWNVAYMSAFFLWGELVIERGTLQDFTKQMQDEFVPTYLAEVAAWPPIMAAIFTRLPVTHHLLAVNLVTVLDVAFLAVIRSGAFSLGGNPASASSSQGEELCDEPSEDVSAPPGSKGHHQRMQQPTFLMPALASMHGGGSAAVKHTCSLWAGLGGTISPPPPQQQQQGQCTSSLIEQWVLPEHRGADAGACECSSSSSLPVLKYTPHESKAGRGLHLPHRQQQRQGVQQASK